MDDMGLNWLVTPDLLGITDSNGRFRHTNPAWYRTLGRLPDDIENRMFFEFVHPDDIKRTYEAFVAIQRGEPILQFENRYRHKDGTYRWLSWNAVPEGDVFVCNARDITAAKETEAALAAQRTEGQLREQFIAVLGHDLRNPLAAAVCATEFLEREAMSENGQIMLRTARDSLQRMSALIDDVLDFARSRLGGDIGVDLEPGTPLRPVLERVVAEIATANPDLPVEEAYDFTDGLAIDGDRIAQLVSNLLSNAVFHGDATRPVRIEARDMGEAVAIAVTNHGPPIPTDKRDDLFEPFCRGEPEDSQNGLGLGLFIARQIAEGHGADLDAHSADGRTTFTLTLPHRRLSPDRPELDDVPRVAEVSRHGLPVSGSVHLKSVG